jgi:hypothetical protein
MKRARTTRYLDLPPTAEGALIAGARDVSPVKGLTHGYYKYPARFSPSFARAAIETFTRPGDICLDPHFGGGTTLVEAIAAGRQAVGVDISALAEFVAGIKCTNFSEAELDALECWAGHVAASVGIHKPSTALSDYQQLGYYKHLNHPCRWRLRKAIEQSLASAIELGTPRMESVGRCVVLRTALHIGTSSVSIHRFACKLDATTVATVAADGHPMQFAGLPWRGSLVR